MKHECKIDNSLWCEEVDNQLLFYVKDYDQDGNEETVHGYIIKFCPLCGFQPERSKREESTRACSDCLKQFFTDTEGTVQGTWRADMRCSELHGNMKRDK